MATGWDTLRGLVKRMSCLSNPQENKVVCSQASRVKPESERGLSEALHRMKETGANWNGYNQTKVITPSRLETKRYAVGLRTGLPVTYALKESMSG